MVFFKELIWEYLSRPALDVTILKYKLHTPQYLKKFPSYTVDDQCRVNFALQSMGLEWSRMPDDKTVIGEDRNELSMVVLPQMDICRHICITNFSHQVGGAHNGTQKAHKGARFLRQDWNIPWISKALLQEKSGLRPFLYITVFHCQTTDFIHHSFTSLFPTNYTRT